MILVESECPACQGKGYMPDLQNSATGQITYSPMCRHCGGKGKIWDKPVEKKGKGR